MYYPHGDGSPDQHLPELYNLKDDPQELRNLATNPKFAAQRRALEAQLATLLAGAGLTPEKDNMPLDEGVKSEPPDATIR